MYTKLIIFCSEYGEKEIITEDQDDSGDDEDLLKIHSITDILNEEYDEQRDEEIVLLSHQRCASHTLNRVAVKDCEAALEDKRYKQISRSTFSNCSSLWTKQNRSTPCADKIKDILGTYFQTPNETR